ncbi:MAG TPA: hypothetical protein VH593_09465 [Ktedonobacteraceae bacterium]|jgi:hypothetical protein
MTDKSAPDTKATQETRDKLNTISPEFPATARKIAAEQAAEGAGPETVAPTEQAADTQQPAADAQSTDAAADTSQTPAS